jgi:hypothetical protein
MVRLVRSSTNTTPPGLVQVQEKTGLSAPLDTQNILRRSHSLLYGQYNRLVQSINEACPPAISLHLVGCPVPAILEFREGAKVRMCGGRRSHTPLLHRGSRRGSRLRGSVLALTMKQAVGDAVLLREDGLAVRALDV